MVAVPENPRVSVVIRTRDTERHLFRLLGELSVQTLRPSEIVVVDNFSSEGKLKNLSDALSDAERKHLNDQIPLKLIPITDDEFSHPFSINLGVGAADGELVCIINGHSLPTSTRWLASAARHFRDPRVAGVSAYFIPHDDGTIWEKAAYDLFWPALSGIYRTCNREDGYFSAINCVIRKSLWEEYPFDENLPRVLPQTRMYGGEDYDWGQEMRARGYRVVLEPRFEVYHSHGQALPEIVERNLVWYRIRREIRSLKRPRESYAACRSTPKSGQEKSRLEGGFCPVSISPASKPLRSVHRAV